MRTGVPRALDRGRSGSLAYSGASTFRPAAIAAASARGVAAAVAVEPGLGDQRDGAPLQRVEPVAADRERRRAAVDAVRP
ncbi:MAG: hypothetical protein R2736_06935 [Solirubrobacterales bacterium]